MHIKSIISFFLFVVFISITPFISIAQTAQQKTENRIAVFTPIYLDSAFNGSEFKIWDNALPKNMLPGLEFYNGIQMAIDSLNREGINNLIIDIYDYKSKGNSLQEILKNSKNKLATSTVIIASFNRYNDIKILADFAYQKKIPLISATYPNDGGITNNPYFFLINPTIQTHVNAIYNNVIQHYRQSNILYLKCKGSFENWVDNYFIESERNNEDKGRFTLKPITLIDSFLINELLINLDSTTNNTILCNCSKEKFIQKIITQLSLNTQYKTVLMGLPTWDVFNISDEVEYKNVPVIFTSAYNYNNSSPILDSVSKFYEAKYYLKPSEFFLKGYETMLRVGKIVSLYEENAIRLLSDNLFKVFSEINIKPHYNSNQKTQIDYFENKKIYHIKKLNGKIVAVD